MNSSMICSNHFSEDCFDQEKFGGTWLKKKMRFLQYFNHKYCN
ncbi:unnamed protein product [Larinioides sclopetarius]|uniref:THAP-type domain-containing protein n=1 Tax=Larinioides sclopetarius TaxID=280406 RepID=A0AAV1ZPD1_9ARAC